MADIILGLFALFDSIAAFSFKFAGDSGSACFFMLVTILTVLLMMKN